MSNPLLEKMKEIDPDLVIKALKACLVAETTGRSGAKEPDTRTQMSAVNLVAQYTIGRPREAQEQEPPKTETVEAIIERAKLSKPYRAAMIKGYSSMLEQLKELP